MKKYLLAGDAYSFGNGDGYNVMPYRITEEGEEHSKVLKNLKQEPGVVVCNLENFSGGGESVEYDAIEIPSDFDVCAIFVRRTGPAYEAKVSVPDDLNKSFDLAFFETLIKNDVLWPFNAENTISIEINKDLTIANSIEALDPLVAENDFAKRHLSGEGLECLKSFFKI